MNTITLDSDGPVFLDPELNHEVILWPSTIVVIASNPDAATLTFGFEDSTGTFVAWPNGLVAEGAVITHGVGCRLMVNVSGFGTQDIELNFFQGS